MNSTRAGFAAALLIVAVGMPGVPAVRSSDAAAAIESGAFRNAGPLTFVSRWPDVPALTLEMSCRNESESNPEDDHETHYAYCERFSGQSEEAGLGIYVGYFPSTFRSRDGYKVNKERGYLGAKKISWYGWMEQIDGTPVLMREAVVKGFFRESGRDSNPDLEELLLHIWVYGASEHEVRALQDAVATLTKLP